MDGSGATQTLTISYDVLASGSQFITSLNSLYQVDQVVGDATFTAVQKIYDSNNTLLGTQTFTSGSAAPGPVAMTIGSQNVHVVVTVVETARSANSLTSASILAELYAQKTSAQLATVGDRVWFDANKDGLQTSGETGVAGVTVALLDATGTTTIAYTTTNAAGNYAFNGVLPGVNEVKFINPVGLNFTTQGVGTDTSLDSNANTQTGITAPITLTAGQTNLTIDAGLTTNASMGATTTTRNYGTVTNGDKTFSNIVVTEVDTVRGGSVSASFIAGSGNAVAVTVGGNLGVGWSAFQMAVLSDGSGVSQDLTITYDVTASGSQFITSIDSLYQIDQVVGDGRFVAVERIYDNNNTLLATQTFTSGVSAPAPAQLSIGVQSAHVVVTVSETATSANSLISASILAELYGQTASTGLATIGDRVWFDANKDGLQSSGETGVAGVTVDLLNAAGTSTIAFTTTNASGLYQFSGVLPGAYEVKFINPTGMSFTTQTVGTNTGIDSNANAATGITAPITVTAGQTNLTIDAGLILPAQQQTGAIGDFVWFDANKDGVQSSGETGVAGVTVDLLDATGTSTLAVTTTNAAGAYLFTGLAAGTYEVLFIAPTGDVFTTALTGTNTGIDSNANAGTGITAPITLTAGQTDLTIDAGLVAKPILGAIGDYVWLDANCNGLQDSGETGVAGVSVCLLGQDTLKLGISEDYYQGNAQYTVAVNGVQIGGTYTATALHSAGQDTYLTLNGFFGAAPTVTVTFLNDAWGGTCSTDRNLYVDSVTYNNVNQNQSAAFYWAGGQTLNLTGPAAPALACTTTGANGYYLFTGLAAGSYEVQFIAPAGNTFTTQTVGTNTAIDSNANRTTGITGPIALTTGQTDLTIDAGLCVKPAAIGDYVWCDANGNGLQDNGEVGVAGITVDLLNAAGTSTLAVTTTNAAGKYLFTGLAAGVYDIKFVAPAGQKFTLQTQGTNGAIDSNPGSTSGLTAPITLTAGQTDLTIDAGLRPDAGISVNKIATKAVVNECGQVTYQFQVKNTGTAPLTNVVIKDNIGSSVHPDIIKPTAVMLNGFNTGDTNRNGLLDAGETWNYQVTTTPLQINASDCGTVSHTCSGGNLHAGNTAWFNCSFTPTNTKDGTCYVFHDVHCNVKGTGTGTGGYDQKCPDAEVRFSSSCTSASTHYDSDKDCWITTLPANCSPGKVFLSGCPVTVPSGCDFTNANCTWTIGDSGNNCGQSTVNWTAGCKGYSNFNQNGYDGHGDYNQIGVKVCDNRSEYGESSSCNTGPANSGWSYNGCGWSYNSCGWVGSNNDCSGTPENHYTSGNCGSSGYWGGSGSTGGTGCGTGTTNTCTQTQVGADMVADTVTVTATTACATVSHTCTGGNLGCGDTAWFNCNFTPTHTSHGTCYVFRDVHCNVTETNGAKHDIDCGDAEIRFSNTCTKATTSYDASRQCWVTTLPANCNPGSVFVTGCPVTVPAGCDFTNAKCSWTVSDSGNNCGDSTTQFKGQCTGYTNNFCANGNDGCADYNKIGVKVCDNDSGYGNGGCTESGYGWCGSGWGNSGGWTCDNWGRWTYQTNNWCGSSSDRCGTPENQFVNSSCAGAATSGSGWGWWYYGGTPSTGDGAGCDGGSSNSCQHRSVPTGCDPATYIPCSTTACGGPVTVTASDTTSVIVVDPSNKLSVDGATPAGSLSTAFGKAQTLEFTYNPSDVVSTRTISIGASTGHNANAMAFIEISNNSNPFASGAQIYFEGTVATGQKLYADASINQLTNLENTGTAAFMSQVAGQGIYAFIFNSQADFLAGAAPVQTDTYNTSGSQAMYANDQIGSLKVIGYVGSTGGYLAS